MRSNSKACNLEKANWLKGFKQDIFLHAILVTGMNLGVRYDELSKLQTDHILVTSGSIQIYIETRIKNSTRGRRYKIQEWPNKDLGKSLFMDPFVAPLTWSVVRGPKKNFVFCEFLENSGGFVVNYKKQFLSKTIC